MIKKINTELIITILIILLLFLIPLHRIITYTLYQLKMNSFLYSIEIVKYLWIFLPIFSLIYLVNIIKKNYKINIYDYIILALTILGVLSCIFAINKECAVFGIKYRKEGLITVLTYFSIYLNIKNMKNEKYKNIIIHALLATGILQSIYAILQTYTSLNIIRRFANSTSIASGLSGNPNFLGTYLVITSLISLTLFVTKKNIIYFIITIIYFIGLISAGSLGPLISFVLSVIFLLIVFRKKINIKKYIEITATLILIFFLTSKTTINTNKNTKKIPINTMSQEITKAMSKENNIDLSSGRFELWKNSIPQIKDYWIIGAGYDNFKFTYHYNNYNRLKSKRIYDKAHNIYLEMLICNGIFYLIIYCILCLITFVKGLKEKNPLLIAIFISFVGYSIQGFANINVIDITWIFFMLIALLNTNETIKARIN